MINKKYCKIRANITAKIEEQYLGKCVIFNWGIQHQDLQTNIEHIYTHWPLQLAGMAQSF